MQTLTCPIPSNINPLQVNGFMFGINKLPDLTFFCQEANIPDLSLNDAMMQTPFTNIPVPGDKLSFGDLQVTFIIDSEMRNYKAINNWLISLGFPDSRDQFSGFVRQNADAVSSVNRSTMSDANLLILNNNNVPIATVTFFDAFPTNLSSINMISTVDNTQFLTGNCTFRYSHFEIT